jgi:fido (protein-threonine AMPylation protein)
MFDIRGEALHDLKAFLSMHDRGILYDHIADVATYNKQFLENAHKVGQTIKHHALPDFVSVENLLEIHGTIFDKLHKNAGAFRISHVTAGKSMPADFQRIPMEMELRRHQLLEIAGPFNLDAVINAAAFGHVRSKAIQPFIDGNKRSSRIQGSCLIFAVHGRSPKWEPIDEYEAAMKEGHRGDLTRLVNHLRRGLELPLLTKPYLAPFRIRPFLLGDEIINESTTLDELFDLSIKHREKRD